MLVTELTKLSNRRCRIIACGDAFQSDADDILYDRLNASIFALIEHIATRKFKTRYCRTDVLAI